jgi:hypothetical protein
MVHGEGEVAWQARMTFAIARHAVVDLSQVLNASPAPAVRDRLPEQELGTLRADLKGAGLPLCSASEGTEKLRRFERLYEPYVDALARHLLISLPGWSRAGAVAPDNWQTSAWERQSTGEPNPPGPRADEEHG